MQTAARYEIEGVGPGEVDAFLAKRPASGMRPFLVLACQSRRSGHASGPWFRMGPMEGYRAELRWRPTAGSVVFERFTGHRAVEPTASGAEARRGRRVPRARQERPALGEHRPVGRPLDPEDLPGSEVELEHRSVRVVDHDAQLGAGDLPHALGDRLPQRLGHRSELEQLRAACRSAPAACGVGGGRPSDARCPVRVLCHPHVACPPFHGMQETTVTRWPGRCHRPRSSLAFALPAVVHRGPALAQVSRRGWGPRCASGSGGDEGRA